MNLLTVIACHNTDCIRAERLIDQIFALNRKEQRGHALILFAQSTPQENRDKVRISAEVTFKSATILNVTVPKDAEEKAAVSSNKSAIAGSLMAQAAKHIARNYRMPWLWLEPDSLPLTFGWMDLVEFTYFSQPMRYMAGHLKWMDGDKEVFSISRLGVYPNDALKDFEDAARANVPLENYVFSMSSKCKLFQNTKIDKVEDFEKLRKDAVLAHSDKLAVLVDKIVADSQREPEYCGGESIAITIGEINPTTTTTKKRGRQPKISEPTTTA